MLARAERRSRQAEKLVQKWKLRLVELDRLGVAATQAKLFADEHPVVGDADEVGFSIKALTMD